LSRAIVSYVFSLVGAFVLALIIDGLAPTFQGRKSQVQALKLVAYASTASWLAGIFALIPGLGILGILGLYSLYLFYTGLPVMMKSPPEKSLPYTAVIIVAAIVVAILAGFLSFSLTGYGGQAGRAANGGTSYGSVTTPNGGSIQLDKLSQALDASAKQLDGSSTAPRVGTDTLKSFLPGALGSLARTETSSAGGQFAGFGASSAEAKYGGGGKQITLTVTDLGAVGSLVSLTGALGISGDQETPTSYSRVSQQEGRTVAEEYDRTAQHGSYGFVIGNRFMVHAEGSSVSMDELHAAVASVDAARLEALGR
jgi:FlaG/FlaF family flagellin (archaellin)